MLGGRSGRVFGLVNSTNFVGFKSSSSPRKNRYAMHTFVYCGDKMYFVVLYQSLYCGTKQAECTMSNYASQSK